MPRGDGMGPNGQGPRTGRGMGVCNGYVVEGVHERGRGRGARACGTGFGRGRGLGFRNRIFQTVVPASVEGISAATPVAARLDVLQLQLEAVREQIAGLRAEMQRQAALAGEVKTEPEQ